MWEAHATSLTEQEKPFCFQIGGRNETINAGSAAKLVDDPDEQAEDETDDHAGYDWEVKRAALAAVDDVAGKAPKAEREFAAEVEKCADEDENTAENEKGAA